jgi:hypothetical protein
MRKRTAHDPEKLQTFRIGFGFCGVADGAAGADFYAPARRFVPGRPARLHALGMIIAIDRARRGLH